MSLIHDATLSLDNEWGELSLGYRRCVWLYLSNYAQADCYNSGMQPYAQGTFSDGHKRRFILAYRSVLKILSIWEENYPLDTLTSRFLDIAVDLMAGRIVLGNTSNLVGSSWQHLEERSYTDRNIALYVGHAAVCCLGVAQYDEPLEGSPEPKYFGDEIEFDQFDTAYIASMIFAGGSKWNVSSSVEKRRQFWLWWLNEAASLIDCDITKEISSIEHR